MDRKHKPFEFHMKMLYAFIALGIVVWLFVLFSTKGYFKENHFTDDNVALFNENWTDADGNPIKVPGKSDIAKGNDYRICHTITDDIATGTSLLFRTDHTFVTAYLNGVEIYRFGVPEQIPFGKSPGSGWQLIDISSAKAGDSIEIVTNCPYDKYSGQIRDIRIGTKQQLVSYIFWSGLGMLVITVIPMLIGGVIILIPPFYFKGYRKRVFFDIGLSFVVLSLWSFTEARTWQLFFKNAYAMQMLNFLTFALLLPTVLLALRAMGFIHDLKLYNIMMTLNIGAAFLLLLLQLSNLVDFFELLIINHILIVVTSLVMVTSFTHYSNHTGIKSRMCLLLYITIPCCAILDLSDFYIWDHFGNGFFTRIEILSLLICIGLTAMKRALIIHNENIEQQTFEKLAYTDTLTSLRNRRGFDEDIEKIEKAGIPVTILYADMNGLKCINDNLGHHSGDRALKLIAGSLHKLTNKDTTCYRLGGDEFCVLSFDQEEAILEKKCEKINNELTAYEYEFNYPIGISYGILRYIPNETSTIHQCLVAADKKMYEFKQEIYQTRERYR